MSCHVIDEFDSCLEITTTVGTYRSGWQCCPQLLFFISSSSALIFQLLAPLGFKGLRFLFDFGCPELFASSDVFPVVGVDVVFL